MERLGDFWVHVDGQVLLEDKLGVALVDALVDQFEERGTYRFVSELPLAVGRPAATGGLLDWPSAGRKSLAGFCGTYQ